MHIVYRELKLLEAPIVRIDDTVIQILQQVEKEERHTILSWMSKTPYGKHHDTVNERRIDGTCEWLLQRRDFQQWEDFSSSAVLWLWGIPGAGKTFLASKVVEHVLSFILDHSPDEGFAFFYCNRDEAGRRDPLSVLRSYASQLSTTSDRQRIQKSLKELYEKNRDRGGEPTIPICKDLILESINTYPRTTLTLDALDECDSGTRYALIEAFDYLLSKAERPLKIFIASRPDGDIRDRFLSQPNIEIQATDNEMDIQRFVNAEITKHRRWNDIKPWLREHITNTLLAKSQGM
jgi:ankyrin repeat domain-containing protein 50